MTPDIFDHWHPVCLSKSLKSKPIQITLHGRDIALFRTKTGAIGAVDNCCPHRHLKLSCGSVHGERLQCAYHGWTFGTKGDGESPGTPKMRIDIDNYEAREAYQMVWIRARGAQTSFPELDHDDAFYFCGTLEHQMGAGIEISLDNFSEIEHTAVVHGLFGYDLEDMPNVSFDVTTTDETVHVKSKGPAKKVSWPIRVLWGFRQSDNFISQWDTYFSPVYSVIDHYWESPDESRIGKLTVRTIVIVSPITDEESRVYTVMLVKSLHPGPAGGMRVFWPLILKLADLEIGKDVDLTYKLADPSPDLNTMLTNRFDNALHKNREMIDLLYRGYKRPQPGAENA